VFTVPAIISTVRVMPGGLDVAVQIVGACANSGRIGEPVGTVVDAVVTLSAVHDVSVAESASWSTAVSCTPQLSVEELTAVRLKDPWVVEFPEML
jgi:hypothetical protein